MHCTESFDYVDSKMTTTGAYERIDVYKRQDFRNALLRLFKLLGGCGGLSLAADLVLLDKQLHKAALMLGGVFRHLPEIGEDTGGQRCV